MKNGAVIYLKSSWALNMANPIEAVTTICGDKAGADMLDGLRINTVIGGRQTMILPDMRAGSVAFFEGNSANEPQDLEARCFTNAILGKGYSTINSGIFGVMDTESWCDLILGIVDEYTVKGESDDQAAESSASGISFEVVSSENGDVSVILRSHGDVTNYLMEIATFEKLFQ